MTSCYMYVPLQLYASIKVTIMTWTCDNEPAFRNRFSGVKMFNFHIANR